MRVTPQLIRIIKEEIEAIDYGKITISINVTGPYTEIAAEKKTRIVKSPDEESN